MGKVLRVLLLLAECFFAAPSLLCFLLRLQVCSDVLELVFQGGLEVADNDLALL